MNLGKWDSLKAGVGEAVKGTDESTFASEEDYLRSDEEDYSQEYTSDEGSGSPEAQQQPSPAAAPPAPAAPTVDPEVERMRQENEWLKNQLTNLSQRPVQYQHPQQPNYYNQNLGYQPQQPAQPEEPYFLTKADLDREMQRYLTPIHNNQVANHLRQVELQERDLRTQFRQAEQSLRTRYGDDFDAKVPATMRAQALENAVSALRQNKPVDAPWESLFQDHYDRQDVIALRAEKAARLQAEQVQAQQREELKKVQGLPRGSARHQQPAAPARKPGEKGWDRMSAGIAAILRQRREA